ncbi:MAG: DUF4149 domain-containing protein [Burkholderiales bacterium]|nr:DUF4149 domain-containing protein [Burkholderiales bacterium]
MRGFADALQSMTATLWVGGMWAIGFIVAPVLFATLPDRALAGLLAGKLFSLIAWTGMACAALLFFGRWVCHRRAVFHDPVLWIVVAMLALTLTGEFGVQPVLADLRSQALPQPAMESVQRDNFAYWHGVAGILYAANCLLGGALIVLQALKHK